ncbi:MAG: isoaspartyl peptidase/L-asparaginase [Deltaproteobacteria bacterium]|nr:isoaspartyl peptidase/L-asparaginase [Deltaproteobacteria bacterium]
MTEALVLTHGGAANDAAVADGCQAACAAALDALGRGGSALDAAVAAVVVLEDDERMNAGTGSTLRLDGSIQTDAAVMDARGFGAVAGLEGIKNPVRVARAVYETPHRLIVGRGARELALRVGLPEAELATARAREKHAARMQTLGSGMFAALWADVPQVFWQKAAQAGGACDTVGAVVRAADGSFAAAGSTGGIWCALPGRVGDVPIPGAGIHVGEAGAVVATGVGELIWAELLCARVHEAMAGGVPAQRAVDDAIAAVRARHPEVDVGLLAVDRRGGGAAVTAQMPWARAQR